MMGYRPDQRERALANAHEVQRRIREREPVAIDWDRQIARLKLILGDHTEEVSYEF